MRFHCSMSGLMQAAPMDRAKRLSSDVVGRPYRITRGSSRGTSVRRSPLAGSTPLTGRQAELVNCQATRSDARRIGHSVASPVKQTRRTALYPPYRAKARTRLPVKGFLDRRSKRVFGYFCRAAKVPEESGGEKPPGQFEKNLPFAPEGREEKETSI